MVDKKKQGKQNKLQDLIDKLKLEWYIFKLLLKMKGGVLQQMDISEYTKQQGKFLKAEDVSQDNKALWEIIGEGELVVSQRFGVERLHIPIKNGETQRIFDCSKTNARFIEEAIGSSDTKQWIGKFLVFETYKTKTSDGKLVDAINVIEVR